MFEPLLTTLSLVSIVLSASLIFFLYKFKRGLPDFQQIFDEFGEGMGATVSELVKDPMVKRSMTLMGKESGRVRANDALKERVAEKVMGSNVLLKKALDWLGISPLEGMELMQDPTIGPMIQNVMAGFAKGGGKGLLGGFSGGGSRRVTYGHEE